MWSLSIVRRMTYLLLLLERSGLVRPFLRSRVQSSFEDVHPCGISSHASMMSYSGTGGQTGCGKLQKQTLPYPINGLMEKHVANNAKTEPKVPFASDFTFDLTSPAASPSDSVQLPYS